MRAMSCLPSRNGSTARLMHLLTCTVVVSALAGCREHQNPADAPVATVRSVIKALQTGDCAALYRTMPPDAAPAEADFLEGCTQAMKLDARAAKKKQDLSASQFDMVLVQQKGREATVRVHPKGLQDRWSSLFRLVEDAGAWRVLGLFDAALDKDAIALPYQPPPASPTVARRRDDMENVPDGGMVTLGCDPDSGPGRCLKRRTERIGPFRIDRLEVTAADYERCVDAGACTPPMFVAAAARKGCNYGAADRPDHPMNCVSYWGALAFCEWEGKRLPTEAEWELAARGTEGRTYPWGDTTPDCTRTIMAGCQPAGTRPAGSVPAGDTPHGIHDLSGNVTEWVLAANLMEAAIRGGAFDGTADEVSATHRRLLGLPYRLDVLGFRCAQ